MILVKINSNPWGHSLFRCDKASADYISVWISIAIDQSLVHIIDNTSKLISEWPP